MVDYVHREYRLKPSSVYVATDEVEVENLDLLQNAGFKLLKKTALVLDQLQTIIVDLQMMSASQEFLSWVSDERCTSDVIVQCHHNLSSFFSFFG